MKGSNTIIWKKSEIGLITHITLLHNICFMGLHEIQDDTLRKKQSTLA